jgi:hypothetical protein
VQDEQDWPMLVIQAHPFDTALDMKPARDRYYFEQNKFIGWF